MSTLPQQPPLLAELDLYLEEGTHLMARSEELLLQLKHDRACEGHLLIGAQILMAMRCTLQLLQEHRHHLEKQAALLPVAPPASAKRPWWAFWRYPQGQPRHIESGRTL